MTIRPGQDGQDSGDQPPNGAVEKPTGVDGELLRLRTGKQHAVVQGMQEAFLSDPAFVVDEHALHDGDLPGGAAEGLQGDQEPRFRGDAQGDQVPFAGAHSDR
ncbi:hypothetical protein RQN9TF_33125 (plasmid) [Rhodococcus qingshengii]|nr:hypothetical protein RQN9TF_33125 [Rhodococcus qingshengii]